MIDLNKFLNKPDLSEELQSQEDLQTEFTNNQTLELPEDRKEALINKYRDCLLYTSPSPRD